jgi:UDPglucose--hexose-1-phosphate uridylyltransferase
MLDLNNQSHRRFNPLTREWVLVSPHRTQRPWQGQVEKVASIERPAYDPNCYLCPGNARAGGHRNPDYESTFVFDNDFAALLPDTPAERVTDGLLVAEGEPGICRVMCFDPRHNLTLALMTRAGIRKVVDAWTSQYLELGGNPIIRHVQIFENRGEMMGASNPHPHCQIWASGSIPNEAAKEIAAQQEYRASTGGCLLCTYVGKELERQERVVYQNEGFVIVTPYWAVWPFEVLVVSRDHMSGLDEFDSNVRDSLSDALKHITTVYDEVFATPFPYTMGFHQRPFDGQSHPELHLHAHFYPPLLRSATVRKFMVGFEMLATPQRDITPESAAARLRDLGSKLPPSSS